MTPAHPIYAYLHTHWDREWYLGFRQYQYRLTHVIDGILEALDQKQIGCFTLDGQTILLEDYLELRPHNQAKLQQYVQSGQLSIGPWYVMPDEFLVSGESLIRNLELGMTMAHAFGESQYTGYLPDTFGHSADIPMILQSVGISSALIWRGIDTTQTLFQWQSPGGQSVKTYWLNQGYFQHAFHMVDSPDDRNALITGWLNNAKDKSPNTLPILFPIGADHLGLVPESFEQFKHWAPQAQLTTPATFMTTIAPHPTKIVTGELTQNQTAYLLPGVYSARLYLKQTNRKLEWRLSRQLEPLLCWLSELGRPVQYKQELALLWKTLLQNHPHDSICGCSIDAVHRENEIRFEQIDQLSGMMLKQIHQNLCQHAQSANQILTLNLGETAYTGVVAITQEYPLNSEIPPIEANQQLLHQETRLDESYLTNINCLPLSENTSTQRTSLIWVNNVPALGYLSTHKLEAAPDKVSISETTLENSQLKITLSPTGQLTVLDKTNETRHNLFHELLRQEEQGDSYNAAPKINSQAQAAIFTQVRIQHDGPLQGTWQLTYLFPDIQMPLHVSLSLRAGETTVWFETEFTNTHPNHKIQATFTLPQPITSVFAEGHFSPITREYDPNYRIQAAMPAASQKELKVNAGPIQRWFCIQQQTWATQGLTEYEVEGNRLKITLLRAFGMLSSPDTGVRGSNAGPPHETPEGQCLNRKANYRYAWKPGGEISQANALAQQLFGSVYGFDRKSVSSNENETAWSFLNWNNPNVLLSACIPTETGTQLRLYNPSSVSQQVTLSKLAQPLILDAFSIQTILL